MSSPEVRLLIVVRDKEQFSSQVNFLRRRGWEVTCVSTLREGIEAVVGTQPDFVLISVNHPNPKVVKLPTILNQTFNTRVILIGEALDSHTATMLNKSGRRDVMHAPVSGPGIQLRVKQILAREKQELKTAQREAEKADNLKNAAAQIRAGNNQGESGQASGGQPRGPMIFAGSGNKVSAAAPSIAAQLAKRGMPGSVGAQAGSPMGQLGAQGTDSGDQHPGVATTKAVNRFSQLAPVEATPEEEIDFTTEQSVNLTERTEKKPNASMIPTADAPNADHVGHYNPQTNQDTFQNSETKAPVLMPTTEEPTTESMPTPAADFGASGETPEASDQAAIGEELDVPKNDSGEAEEPNLESASLSQQGGDSSDSQSADSEEDNASQSQQGGLGKDILTPEAQQSSSANDLPKSEAGDPKESQAESDSNASDSNPSAEEKSKKKPFSSEMSGPVLHTKEEKEIDIKSKKPKFTGSNSDTNTILRIIQESYEDCVTVKEKLSFKEYDLSFDLYYISAETTSGFMLYSSKNKFILESHLIPKINTKIIEGVKQAGFHLGRLDNVDPSYLKRMGLNMRIIYQNSEMSLISGQEDEELVLSFLDTSSSATEIISDGEKNMVGFPVSMIAPEIRSPFKVYLYLPVNEKYYLYLNEGNSFTNKQLNKLDTKGVSHLYIHEQDRELLSDFFMSKMLYDKLKTPA